MDDAVTMFTDESDVPLNEMQGLTMILVAFIKMKFTITDHAFEKHLFYSQFIKGTSVFHSKHIMISTVTNCLKEPDDTCRVNNRIYFKTVQL